MKTMAHGGQRQEPVERPAYREGRGAVFGGAGAMGLARRLRLRGQQARLRAVKEGQDLGHRGVEFGRNGLAHFGGLVEGLRQDGDSPRWEFSCQRAISLIFWASRLRPLATTTGAAMVSGRYSMATA